MGQIFSMTLIAGAVNLHAQSPIMFADILIANKVAPKLPPYLPLSGRTHLQDNSDGHFIYGIKKKFFVIGERIAVAWAGSILIAESIVKRLRDNNVAPEDFERALDDEMAEYERHEQDQVSFLGLLQGVGAASPGATAVRMFARNTTVIARNNWGFHAICAGSGSQYISKSFAHYARTFNIEFEGKLSGTIGVNLPLLHAVMEAQYKETIFGPDLSAFFGGGFNVVGMERVAGRSILSAYGHLSYVFGEAYVRNSSNIQFRIRSPIVHVEELERYSLFIIDYLADQRLIRQICPVTTMFGAPKILVDEEMQKLVLSSQQTVLLFLLIYIEGKNDPSDEPMSICLIDSDQNRFKVERGRGRLDMDFDYEEIALAIFDHVESR